MSLGRATEKDVRSALLIALFVFSSPIADAREIRRDAIPEALRGTWATSTDGCKDAGKSQIVLSAKSYVGPAGRCDVDYVMETPGRGGAICLPFGRGGLSGSGLALGRLRVIRGRQAGDDLPGAG